MTKELVEKLISKPKMATKLLNKPPFRFLHDIVREIQTVTGFPSGLFTPEELVSSNVKDKASKIAFLAKIISALSFTVDRPLFARPEKIVAGLEPEATNVFLQTLACVATVEDSSSLSKQAIQRVLNGELLRPESSTSDARSNTSTPKQVEPGTFV